MRLKAQSSFFIAAALLAVGCKPRTFNAVLQSTEQSSFAQQFEVTRFATCRDSKGKDFGGLDFVWRIKKSNGESVTPYILGFAGSVMSLDGQKFEFRSVSTIDEPRYIPPTLKAGESYPVESYIGYSLQYPDSETKSGWGFQKINGKDVKITDVTGGVFMIPKSKEAGAFAGRYFVVTNERKTLEFNCQPVSDVVRERMKTYLVSDGSHGFKGNRGQVVGGSTQPATQPTAAANPTPSTSTFDLRPPNRPASYDVQFSHERIYDCGANGAIDVIWRKAESTGAAVPAKDQYILGLAGKINDPQSKKSVAFSSVSIDSAPAFSAGQPPSPVSFLMPMFEFSDSELKSNLSYHSSIPGLEGGRRTAVGGTLWMPYDGSGNSVSIAIATGSSVRGAAFQVISDCTALHPRINELITRCVGRGSGASCPR